MPSRIPKPWMEAERGGRARRPCACPRLGNGRCPQLEVAASVHKLPGRSARCTGCSAQGGPAGDPSVADQTRAPGVQDPNTQLSLERRATRFANQKTSSDNAAGFDAAHTRSAPRLRCNPLEEPPAWCPQMDSSPMAKAPLLLLAARSAPQGTAPTTASSRIPLTGTASCARRRASEACKGDFPPDPCWWESRSGKAHDGVAVRLLSESRDASPLQRKRNVRVACSVDAQVGRVWGLLLEPASVGATAVKTSARTVDSALVGAPTPPGWSRHEAIYT